MLPFRISLSTGDSPFRQIVYAATRAVVSGEMSAGLPFPSVRELSQELKINPNTAHKVVAELVRIGLIEVLPGVGTVVSADWRASAEEREHLLSEQIERLLVDARRLGLSLHDVTDAIHAHWLALTPPPASVVAPNNPVEQH